MLPECSSDDRALNQFAFHKNFEKKTILMKFMGPAYEF